MTYALESARCAGRFAEELPREVAARWLAEAPAWFQGGARLASLDSPLGPAVAKEILPGRPAFRRRRRARRSFDDALAIGAAGVATPQPLAALWPRKGRGPAALVCERVPLPTLAAWLAEGAPGDRDALARAIADALARLHRNGLRHRDLKAPNVLVDVAEPGCVLLDLDGVRRARPGLAARGRRGRARDLARLLCSVLAAGGELDRCFWRPLCARYAERAGEAPDAIDAPARRWAERHLARNRRRGRPTL